MPVGARLLAVGVRAIEFVAPENWGTWSVIVLIACLCLAISGFVSGSEIAYFGLSRAELDELEEDESPEASRVLTLLKNPEQLLATILITNNLVNITMVVLLAFAINQAVRFNSTLINFLVQTVFLTFLLLLCGEILPKLVARNRTMKWVMITSGGVNLLYRLTSPLARLMVSSMAIVNRLIKKNEANVTTDELEKALEISDLKEGKDKEMLEGILSFGEKEVSDVMIPRVDVTDIEFHAQWDEVVEIIRTSGYSRLPVYDTNQDEIRGVLYAKDLIPYIGKRDNSFRWQTLIREAYFVPDSRMIDDLLEDFRTKKIHIAIVVDEYGGTRGIVTLEDIIEEIVGEIDDEYDERHAMYRRIAPTTYVFDAKVPISEFCRDVDIEEEELGDFGEAETLAGLLLAIKGDFPVLKETFKRGPCNFLVLKMDRHRITEVRVNVNKQ